MFLKATRHRSKIRDRITCAWYMVNIFICVYSVCVIFIFWVLSQVSTAYMSVCAYMQYDWESMRREEQSHRSHFNVKVKIIIIITT